MTRKSKRSRRLKTLERARNKDAKKFWEFVDRITDHVLADDIKEVVCGNRCCEYQGKHVPAFHAYESLTCRICGKTHADTLINECRVDGKVGPR